MVQVATTTNVDFSRLPKSPRPKPTGFVYFLAFMAVVGGFLFGYDTGVVSSAMLYIPDAMDLNYLMTELIVSVTLVACAIFSIAAGFSNDLLGRRKTILFASGLFTVGAVLLGAAVNPTMLLMARFIIGAAVGLASMTVPTYLGETCPVHIRGRMVTGFQLMITLGFFLASVLGGAFSYVEGYGWRLMVAVAGIPSFLQFVGFLFLPESPRWLATNGREEEARKILMRIYGNNEEWVDFELTEIKTSHQQLLEEQEMAGGGKFVIVQMLKKPPVRKALFLGCALQGFQQLSGVNTLMFYTASIIKMSGVGDPSTAIWMSCAVTGVNFLCTFIPILLVERLGRKKLLLASMIGVIGSLWLLGGAFTLINKTAPTVQTYNISSTSLTKQALSDYSKCEAYSNCDNCVTEEICGFCYQSNQTSNSNNSFGFCLPSAIGESQKSELGPCFSTSLKSRYIWAWNYCPTPYSWLPILGMVCYLCAFSTGLAPMPWVINAEIYPQWARSTGISWATATNWIFNLVISQTFLNLTEALTKYGTFFFYSGITITAWIIFYFAVPETKGVRIEDVEMLFGGKKPPMQQVSSIPLEHDSLKKPPKERDTSAF